MPEANAENLREISEEYMKSLVEFIGVLWKIQERICSICVKRKECESKDMVKKLWNEVTQTTNIPRLVILVGVFTEFVSREIFLQAIVAMQKPQKKELR